MKKITLFLILQLAIFKAYPQQTVWMDTSFHIGAGFDSYVLSMALQPNGKILAGGLFTSYGGAFPNYFTRLNAGGGVDSTFHTGTGFSDEVDAILPLPDGKIIVGGGFEEYNNVPRKFIACVDSNGKLDTTIFVSTLNNALISSNQSVLLLQPDGKVIGAGAAGMYRYTSSGKIDTTFNHGNIVEGWINSADLQPDGKIVVGGQFDILSGRAFNGIARLNSDGSPDTTFHMGTISVNSLNVYVKVCKDGKIIVSGIGDYDGVKCNGLARLNSNGILDGSFSFPPSVDIFVLYVGSVIELPFGDYLVGGSFHNKNTPAWESNFILLKPDGSEESAFNTVDGFSGLVTCMQLQPDYHLIVGGKFTAFNQVACNYITRLTYAALDGIEAPAIKHYATLFPNPSGGSFNLRCAKQMNRLVVTDALGRMVAGASPHSANYSLNLTGSNNGLYFIKVIYDNGCEILPVIKQ